VEVNGEEKIKRISLDVSPLFFRIVSRLVQALVIICGEVFQALVVERNVLLPKPCLDPGFDGVVGWKSPASEMFFFSVCQTRESPWGPSLGCTMGGMGPRHGFGSRTYLSTTRACKISSYVMTSA
jgi:hypothetical protein